MSEETQAPEGLDQDALKNAFSTNGALKKDAPSDEEQTFVVDPTTLEEEEEELIQLNPEKPKLKSKLPFHDLKQSKE